jgi:hypothetical protein
MLYLIVNALKINRYNSTTKTQQRHYNFRIVAKRHNSRILWCAIVDSVISYFTDRYLYFTTKQQKK